MDTRRVTLIFTCLMALSLPIFAASAPTPCDVKKEYEKVQSDIAVLEKSKDFAEPVFAKPRLTASEVHATLKELDTALANVNIDQERARLAELQQQFRTLSDQAVQAALARTLAGKIAGLETEIRRIETQIKTAPGGDEAAKAVIQQVKKQRDIEQDLNQMVAGMDADKARQAIADANVPIPAPEVIAANKDLAKAQASGDQKDADAAKAALAKADTAARESVKKSLRDWDAAAALIKEKDPTLLLRRATADLESKHQQLESAQNELSKLALPPGLIPEDIARKRSALGDEMNVAEKHLTNYSARASWRQTLAEIEAWDRHEKVNADYQQLTTKRDAIKESYSALDANVRTLVAGAKTDLDGLSDRMQKNPNPKFKAEGIKKAKADAGLRKLADAAKGNSKDPAYVKEAKRLVYNEVRRLEREHLTQLADDLSNYDCWTTAKDIIDKLMAAARGPLLAEVTAALTAEGLGTIDAIPDLYAFPWAGGEGEPAAQGAVAGKGFFGLVKKEVGNAAGPAEDNSGTWSGSQGESSFTANYKAKPPGDTSVTLQASWSAPSDTLKEDDTITLTCTASASISGKEKPPVGVEARWGAAGSCKVLEGKSVFAGIAGDGKAYEGGSGTYQLKIGSGGTITLYSSHPGVAWGSGGVWTPCVYTYQWNVAPTTQPGPGADNATAAATQPAANAESGTNFSGRWDSDYQGLRMTQDGNNVTGTYHDGEGKLDGVVAGNVLTFHWSDSGTSLKGSGRFTLAADAQSFKGYFTFTENPDEGDKHDWNARGRLLAP